MSHPSRSCCHAAHNADGGLLEVVRLIQVLPAEVRERLKEPRTKKKTLLPWPSSKIKLSVAFKCLGWRPEAALSQQNWRRRAAFSLCLQGLSASFGRLSRIPPQSTQSHAEKKHTGMHVSLHGLLFHWLKISEWFCIFYNRHGVAPASSVHALQPLWHVHHQFLYLYVWNLCGLLRCRCSAGTGQSRWTDEFDWEESKGWGRVVGLPGFIWENEATDPAGGGPAQRDGERKNSWQIVRLKDKRFERFARRDAKPSFSFLKAVWFFVSERDATNSRTVSRGI